MELEGRFLADASKEQTENAKDRRQRARLKAQEMAEKRAQDALEIKVESPNPEARMIKTDSPEWRYIVQVIEGAHF